MRCLSTIFQTTNEDHYHSPKPINMRTANLGFCIAIAEKSTKHRVHGETLIPKTSLNIGRSLTLLAVSSKTASRLAALDPNFSSNACVTLALARRASCAREWVSMASACRVWVSSSSSAWDFDTFNWAWNDCNCWKRMRMLSS